jgi:hypothetical protein
VRGIVRRTARNDNRFSALVLGVVESGPFQRRVKRAESHPAPAGQRSSQ